MKRTFVDHEFVEFIPSVLAEGVVYVSIPYATAVHLCACGCGTKVVTPISPADWQLSFDGESISLYPSIGNWQFPCLSHYWIRENKINWAGAWSDKRIAEGRRHDAEDLDSYYAARKAGAESAPASPERPEKVGAPRDVGSRLRRWFSVIRR